MRDTKWRVGSGPRDVENRGHVQTIGSVVEDEDEKWRIVWLGVSSCSRSLCWVGENCRRLKGFVKLHCDYSWLWYDGKSFQRWGGDVKSGLKSVTSKWVIGAKRKGKNMARDRKAWFGLYKTRRIPALLLKLAVDYFLLFFALSTLFGEFLRIFKHF